MHSKIVSWSGVLISVALAGRSELHSSTFDLLGKKCCVLLMIVAAGVEELSRL